MEKNIEGTKFPAEGELFYCPGEELTATFNNKKENPAPQSGNIDGDTKESTKERNKKVYNFIKEIVDNFEIGTLPPPALIISIMQTSATKAQKEKRGKDQ